jgi:hypothetical protein
MLKRLTKPNLRLMNPFFFGSALNSSSKLNGLRYPRPIESRQTNYCVAVVLSSALIVSSNSLLGALVSAFLNSSEALVAWPIAT